MTDVRGAKRGYAGHSFPEAQEENEIVGLLFFFSNEGKVLKQEIKRSIRDGFNTFATKTHKQIKSIQEIPYHAKRSVLAWSKAMSHRAAHHADQAGRFVQGGLSVLKETSDGVFSKPAQMWGEIVESRKPDLLIVRSSVVLGLASAAGATLTKGDEALAFGAMTVLFTAVAANTVRGMIRDKRAIQHNGAQEEIVRLQKRVLELEKENASLRNEKEGRISGGDSPRMG